VVDAYLHLEQPCSVDEIKAIFPESDEVHVSQVFPNSFLLGSHFISPSQLKHYCQTALGGSRYVIMILKMTKGKTLDFFSGGGASPASSRSSDAPARP
jgi:hypothetical protein